MITNDYKNQIENLKAEISKLKADKDFVWSLWKRLQLSSPDLTDAVSLITQREKEKFGKSYIDLQDMVRVKDDTVCEMQLIIEKKNIEIENLTKSLQDMSKRALELEKLCTDLANKASQLDHLLGAVDESHQRKIIDEYELERQGLSETISRLQNQVTVLTREKSELQVEQGMNLENLKWREEAQISANCLCRQLEEANKHIGTQEETIRMLREQLERTVESSTNEAGEEGYSSDRTVEYRLQNHGDIREEERALSPIEDLNYKMDRLSLHVRQLQDCTGTRSGNNQHNCRSKSTPPRKHFKLILHQEEMSRKIQFLSQKLSKTEMLLTEEKRISESTAVFLEKANKRVKNLQLTIKTIRKELEESKLAENDWKKSFDQVKTGSEASMKEIFILESQIQKLSQHSVNDAARIQDLLTNLEKTRDDLTEKKIRQDEESSKEIGRLRDLVKQLENEKCSLETQFHGDMVARNQKLSLMDKPYRQGYSIRNGWKTKLTFRPKPKGNKKTRNMCSILNHFSSTHSREKRNIKDDEWEDVESGEEFSKSEMTLTDRTGIEGNSDPSTASRIAKATARNQCYNQGDSGLNRHLKAKLNHINRIKDVKETNSSLEQVTVAKNRVASLRQQLKIVIESRDSCKFKLQMIESDLRILQGDLSQSKLRCSRLAESNKKLEEQRQAQALGNESGDISRSHDLQQELVMTREKLTKLDRENQCKRRLVDDLRSKLLILESERDTERNSMESKLKRFQELEDSGRMRKTQLDSLQTRYQVVLEERRRFELEASNLAAKLDSVEAKCGELRQSKQALEVRTTTALERAALEIASLRDRGGRCEALILELASDFQEKIREIHRLVELGARALDRTDNLSKPAKDSSDQYARNMAAHILEMAPAEIDALLQGKTVRPASIRHQQGNNSAAPERRFRFSEKCRKALTHVAFERVIRALFVERLEELVELVVPVSCDSGCVSLA